MSEHAADATGALQLRQAGAADSGVIATLLVAFNAEFGTPAPPAAVLEDRLRDHLAAGALLAVVGGEPVSSLALLSPRRSVWYAGPVAILDELYVVPGRRGEGLGSALLAYTEAMLADHGVAALEINVDSGDTDARRFYERHGYANHEPGATDQLLYYFRELAPPA
ncbi:MAG: GNAT family N-acetyltransferase [Patulibacter minatonensis]